MKKLPVLVGVVAGAVIGFSATISDGLGLQIVMMSIGVIAGFAIGSAFSQQSKKIQIPLPDVESFGQGMSARNRMRNFWRDRGRTVRFMEPPHIGGTPHDFD